jgi:hypothetical protein
MPLTHTAGMVGQPACPLPLPWIGLRLRPDAFAYGLKLTVVRAVATAPVLADADVSVGPGARV